MLTEKEQELVAISASIAAGCQPCTWYHFRVARAAGAGDEEIRQAVSTALDVRANAAKVMAGLAEKRLGGVLESDTLNDPKQSLIGQLASVSAAYAVNCVTSLEKHLDAARALGATDHQIQTVLGIARAVKNMAGQRVEAAAAKATQDSESGAVDYVCPVDRRPASPASAETSCCGAAQRGEAATKFIPRIERATD